MNEERVLGIAKLTFLKLAIPDKMVDQKNKKITHKTKYQL